MQDKHSKFGGWLFGALRKETVGCVSVVRRGACHQDRTETARGGEGLDEIGARDRKLDLGFVST